MNPYRVTITGADDAVDPRALLDLSAEFPFVEWGLLCSMKRIGTSRYPSPTWIDRLRVLRWPQSARFFSAHFCGQYAREAIAGHAFMEMELELASKLCARVQINGYEAGFPGQLPRLARKLGVEFILQCRHQAELQQCARDAETIRGASVLFDPSGGRGSRPRLWPMGPAGCRLGFAGGIGPENVLDVIRAIGPRAPYWIDMESGVRTGDRLDLGKVRRVLEQVAALGLAEQGRRVG